jgi:ABC-2 type transport system permease protein
VAEQISSVVIIPLMGIMLAQMAGIVTLNLTMMLISIVSAAALSFAMLHLGSAVFERENILTRWK